MKCGFLVLLLGLVGCVDPHPDDWMIPPPDPSESWYKDCSGAFSFNGCDDCNPCTDDIWCDPMAHTGLVSTFCVNAEVVTTARCIHVEWTSADTVVDSCFPVRAKTDVRAGKCCAGQCIDNNETCEG